MPSVPSSSQRACRYLLTLLSAGVWQHMKGNSEKPGGRDGCSLLRG